MTGWLVDVLSRTLDPIERDAVLGDLAESRGTALHALRDLLGLVARRQAAVWRQASPWFALIALVVPLGSLLNVASVRTADGTSIYLWMFANNWDTALLSDPAYQDVLVSFGFSALMSLVILACWAWTAGLALGSWSHRAAGINGILFCLLLLLGVPSFGGLSVLHRARELPNNAVVFGPFFYRILFPILVQACIVEPAAVFGIRRGSRLALERRFVLPIAATATMAAILLQPGWRLRGFGLPWAWSVVPLLSCWPIIYWIVTPIHRRVTTRNAVREGY